MTRTEKQVISMQKEVEKLQKSLARYQRLYEKKLAKCEQLNCNWTSEEAREHYAERDKWVVYFDKKVALSMVEETQHNLDRAIKRLAQMEGKLEVETEKTEAQKVEEARSAEVEGLWTAYTKKTAEERRAEYEKWLAMFKAECLKDGITIEDANANFFTGTTKSGKHFSMYINNGVTERSLYCYTLNVEGDTVFTSGTFNRGYAYCKR